MYDKELFSRRITKWLTRNKLQSEVRWLQKQGEIKDKDFIVCPQRFKRFGRCPKIRFAIFIPKKEEPTFKGAIYFYHRYFKKQFLYARKLDI